MSGGKQRKNPISKQTIDDIVSGIEHLKEARDSFWRAEANNAAIAVNKAIKSAAGALRHANTIYTVLNRGSFNP